MILLLFYWRRKYKNSKDFSILYIKINRWQSWLLGRLLYAFDLKLHQLDMCCILLMLSYLFFTRAEILNHLDFYPLKPNFDRSKPLKRPNMRSQRKKLFHIGFQLSSILKFVNSKTNICNILYSSNTIHIHIELCISFGISKST